jgi:hypothetical protein
MEGRSGPTAENLPEGPPDKLGALAQPGENRSGAHLLYVHRLPEPPGLCLSRGYDSHLGDMSYRRAQGRLSPAQPASEIGGRRARKQVSGSSASR